MNLSEILERYWGYENFLPLQKEAMECALNRRDSLVVLPTGGGKSLCYQAPAVALPGMAVVVSPLISLMKDQVDALLESGIEAACLNSSLKPEERRAVYGAVREGRLKLIYVAPERLLMDDFQELLREVSVSFFAVDEAHCISLWGHDFRRDYRALRILIEQLVDQEYLEKKGDYHLLHVTPRGRQVLKEKETPRVLKPADKPKMVSKAARESWEGVDRELFELLRKLRREKAKEKGAPAFIVFSDAALRDMARRRPTTLGSFLQVHGVGRMKSEEYGEVFVQAIAEHSRIRFRVAPSRALPRRCRTDG